MRRRLHHLAAHVCASAGETARKTIARQQDEIERLKAQLAAQQRPEPQPTAAAPDDAPILDGVLVIDLTTAVAGPAASVILADLGARVIKVETPRGDDTRYSHRGVGFEDAHNRSYGPAFEHLNRGKESVALNLKTPGGVRTMKALLAQADVFVTNVRNAGLQRLGLDYESLREEFPRLIMAQLSAWGLTGDEIGSPGYDLGAWWARGGVMHPEKERNGQLQPQHPAVGDHATGAFLAGGVGFALLHRQRTGRGQLVDASLQHSGVWCNAWLIVSAASDPELGERWTRERGDYGFGPSANVCESVSALAPLTTLG